MNQFQNWRIAIIFIFMGALLFGCSKFPEEPVESVEKVISDLGNGNVSIIWEALPESYRADLSRLAHEAGEMQDPEVYDRIFALTRKVGVLLEEKKDFILDFARREDGEPILKLEPVWGDVTELIAVYSDSEISTTEGLAELDIERFLKGTVSEAMTLLDRVGTALGEDSFLLTMKNATVSEVSRDGDTAVLKIEIPGEEPQEHEFVRVESRWVPSDTAEQWTQMIAEADEVLAEGKERVGRATHQIVGLIAMADSMLNKLMSAETQAEFDSALETAVQSLMGAALAAIAASDMED